MSAKHLHIKLKMSNDPNVCACTHCCQVSLVDDVVAVAVRCMHLEAGAADLYSPLNHDGRTTTQENFALVCSWRFRGAFIPQIL